MHKYKAIRSRTSPDILQSAWCWQVSVILSGYFSSSLFSFHMIKKFLEESF